jgi:hypothetical protein
MTDFIVCSGCKALHYKLVSNDGSESEFTYQYETLVAAVADAYEVPEEVRTTALNNLKGGFDVKFETPDHTYYIVCGVPV